jgi:hypothetical protein
MGPRSSLDVVTRRAIPVPARTRTPVIQPVANDYMDWSIPVIC